MLKVIDQSVWHPKILHVESGQTCELPHGSGIDYDWNWTKSEDEDNVLEFSNYWHAMDGTDTYCGSVYFEVMVSFEDGKFNFDIDISNADIDSIISSYEQEENEDGEIETNAPYLDDLEDIILSAVESCNWRKI